MLTYPLSADNLTVDLLTYTDVIQTLKRDHDIDLVIDFVPAPQTSDYAGLLQTMLKVNSTEHDIYQIDVVWPGEFGDKFLDLSDLIPKELRELHNPDIYNSNNIMGKQGKLFDISIKSICFSQAFYLLSSLTVAVPFYADYGILSYRTDLLAKYNFSGPPKTWDEMESMMQVIVPAEQRTNPSFFGFVGQMNAYEGLTCNALEWIASNGGGLILDPRNRTVTVDNPLAAEILLRIKSWMSPSKSFTPLASLVYDEGMSKDVWLKGNALFIRQWSGMHADVNTSPTFPRHPVTKIPYANITRLPGRTANQSAATLGGFQLAVNKYTRNATAAVTALKLLITPEFQLKMALAQGVMPTIMSVYKDPAFCTLVPFCFIYDTLQVVARPSAAASPYYLAASQEVYLRTNKILRDDVPVLDGLQDLRVAIEQAIGTYVDPSKKTGPPDFVAHNGKLGIAFQAIAGTTSFLGLVLFLIIFSYRHHRLLTAASPLFLLIMVAGTCVGHATVFVYTGMPTDLKCVLQPWLLVGGFSITAAALIARTWRIYQVFRNTFTFAPISNAELLKTCAYLNAFNLFILVLWTMFSPPGPAVVVLKDAQFWTCKSRNGGTGWLVMGILLIYNGALLGAAVFLTAKTHKVQGPFNETKFVGYTVYTLVLVNVILIPLSNIDAMGASFQYIFRCLAIEISALSITANMFLPKVIALFWYQDLEPYLVSHSFLKSQSYAHSELDSTPRGGGPPMKMASNLAGAGGKGGDTSFQILDGMVCVRWSTTRWKLSFSSWKAVRIGIVPSMKIMFLFAPQGEVTQLNEKDELGLAVEVRTVVMEDYSIYNNGEYIFECVVNGTFFQFQVGSEEARRFWVTSIGALAVGGYASKKGSVAVASNAVCAMGTLRKGSAMPPQTIAANTLATASLRESVKESFGTTSTGAGEKGALLNEGGT
ncbi:hypothetical protein HDU96_010769 [Phlyctochytrium bullatum]|nr:hypothetical protein HDU96_010769 [Phlyctochytrium bullatum]